MGQLKDVTRRDAIADSDSVVFNRADGATNQIALPDFVDSLDITSGFANVIDATGGNYTLVPDSDNPVTIVEMAGSASGYALTIPPGAFTIGAIFEVTNSDVDELIDITLGSGVTCSNVTSGSSYIDTGTNNQGDARVKFVYIGSNDWAAYGDFGNPA